MINFTFNSAHMLKSEINGKVCNHKSPDSNITVHFVYVHTKQ